MDFTSIRGEIRPRDGFQLRNPNPDFTDFAFSVRLGNPKKDSKTILMNSGLLFAELCVSVKTAVLKDSFSNPFSYLPIER